MSNVKNIRFLSGENCIGEIVSEQGGTVTLKDVIVAMPINEAVSYTHLRAHET